MPAGATYTNLATTTLGSDSASITFSSISSSFTDIIVVGRMVATSGGSNNVRMRFNGDSGNNYSLTWLYGDGTSAGSTRNTNVSGITLSYPNSSNGINPEFIVHVQNYSNSTTYKTALVRNSWAGSNGAASAQVGLWRDASTINQISFHTTNTNFGAGMTITLYGIAAA